MPPKQKQKNNSNPIKNSNPITNNNNSNKNNNNNNNASSSNSQQSNQWQQKSAVNQMDNYAFGDVSVDSTVKNQESIMDSKLKKLNLIRRAIPKDGSCLYRAVCSQKFGNQNFHYLCKPRSVILLHFIIFIIE